MLQKIDIKSNNSILLGFILVVVLVAALFNVKKISSNYPDKMPPDFNFIAKVYSSLYEINTYNGTFTKNLNWDRDTTISFQLDPIIKKMIYKAMVNADIGKYPTNYAPIAYSRVFPSFNYYIKYTFDSESHEISWKENTESTTKDAKELKGLFDKIFEDILITEKVKALPPTERGAM